MLKKLIFIIMVSSMVCGHLIAAEGVDFLISIQQMDQNTGEKVPIYSQNTTVQFGIAASAFLPGLSLDIEIVALDSQRVEFNLHTVTLGPQSKAMAKRFKSEYGLPAVLDSIEVKPGAYFSLTLVPESLLTLDESQCKYNHNSSDEFTSFPSANFELHFLKSSLANYHAPSIKLLFEGEFRAFRDKFHFNMTSNPIIYCFPCPVHSVIWDFRFGTAVDPTRNNCYTLYHAGVNTADPFVLIHEAILRSYGYAPQFLSDGWAGYLTLALHKMKQIKVSNSNLPLAELLSTEKYLSAEPQIAEASAATFVRYLIDQYSISKFKELYASANDLNLQEDIEAIYGKPFSALEQEWLHYVDTTKIPDLAYETFARRAEQMFDYPQMFEYSKVFADRATTHADSAQRLAQLARAYYFIGAYYGAVETQEKLTKLEPNNSKYRFGLATFRMMNGEYEQAHDDLIAAQSPDFNQGFIQFNLALNWLERGDSSKAKSILEELVTTGESVSLQGEARTLLGYILLKSKDSIVKQQARDHFNFAIGYFNQQIQTNPAVPSPYMWSGIAMLGLDDVENAIERLQLGLFLESRPFYFGMINLWLGKAADLKKEHELAKEYYSEVMAGESAAYHQEEARLHLEKAYTQ